VVVHRRRDLCTSRHFDEPLKRRADSHVSGLVSHFWFFCRHNTSAKTRKVIKCLRDHRLSFSDCIAALDAALADLTLRLTGEKLSRLAI